MSDSTLSTWSQANTVAALNRWQSRLAGPSAMLDVSRMRLGSACPRCTGRRVYALDENKNLWLCIANAMPVPWRHDQVKEHDAAEFTQDPQVT